MISSGSLPGLAKRWVWPSGMKVLWFSASRITLSPLVTSAVPLTNGDKVILLAENQSTYIPLGQTHRLANPGKVPLEIIEVQSGSYLGEDDIVRFEDTYGRS